MDLNSNENVLSFNFGTEVAADYSDPVADLLNEFEYAPEEVASVPNSGDCTFEQRDLSKCSNEELLEFIENRVSNLRQMKSRLKYYSGEIEMHME